jgi:hypothetical protein
MLVPDPALRVGEQYAAVFRIILTFFLLAKPHPDPATRFVVEEVDPGLFKG